MRREVWSEFGFLCELEKTRLNFRNLLMSFSKARRGKGTPSSVVVEQIIRNQQAGKCICVRLLERMQLRQRDDFYVASNVRCCLSGVLLITPYVGLTAWHSKTGLVQRVSRLPFMTDKIEMGLRNSHDGEVHFHVETGPFWWKWKQT